jgi:hypothetical protein
MIGAGSWDTCERQHARAVPLLAAAGPCPRASPGPPPACVPRLTPSR